jgi:hypothetical protein
MSAMFGSQNISITLMQKVAHGSQLSLLFSTFPFLSLHVFWIKNQNTKVMIWDHHHFPHKTANQKMQIQLLLLFEQFL